jgi:hypothetical protein
MFCVIFDKDTYHISWKEFSRQLLNGKIEEIKKQRLNIKKNGK